MIVIAWPAKGEASEVEIHIRSSDRNAGLINDERSRATTAKVKKQDCT